MAALDRDWRKLLENTVRQARRDAEYAAEAALNVLGAQLVGAPPALDATARDLRTALRARAKAFGDGERTRGWEPLIEEIAYEQWHQMLFARFLAENQLLMHPELNVPVSLDECAELASHEDAEDGWRLAVRYASVMLPGLFRVDDPAVRVRLAPEGRVRLERLVMGLPADVFTADDSLGWVYQYWQADRKAEVNRSGRKIGAEELSPVTQLFTEDYMVRFLLENSVGAWWASRHPESPLLREFEYLRLRFDGIPAAGSFSEWPASAAEITVMDPCCGSGHFLVAAFDMLRRMRMEEESLNEAEAGEAVLRDNLHGLELDARCVQIATFAVAFAAWKEGGYRELPAPRIACSGISVNGQLEDWLKLAGEDARMRASLTEMHALFREAPTLGSLIDPQRTAAQPVRGQQRLLGHQWERLEGVISTAPIQDSAKDPVLGVLGHDAEGVARAATLLESRYTLIATNVPFLSASKQSATLSRHLDVYFPEGRADLATSFLQRCLGMAVDGGTVAIVTPQNWLTLGSYTQLRELLISTTNFRVIATLGPAAFQDMNWWAATTLLSIVCKCVPGENSVCTGIDASSQKHPAPKSALLRNSDISIVAQYGWRRNPDSRILLSAPEPSPLLSQYAESLQGIATGDYPRFGRKHWEIPLPNENWDFQQSTVEHTSEFGGCEHILWWPQDAKNPFGPSARVQGQRAWDNCGVAVSQMRHLPCALHAPTKFDNNTAIILPRKGHEDKLAAIWAFCSSAEFADSVRRIDPKSSVTNATLVKVPFDLDHWQRIAGENYPHGLPEPHTNDPRQWIFKGAISESSEPLQVAVARLLGYHWPSQESDRIDAHEDSDGIVPLPPVRTEQSGAERLRGLLADAYGAAWSTMQLDRLLNEVGFGGKDLATWLSDRKGFFAQHCALFDNRPFIWHLWDGAPDGFSALINYHKLTPATLDRLIYSYLGDWIANQRHLAAAGEVGAEGRLASALNLQEKLISIRQGKPPFDIYARWKPLYEQPIGWDPDLDDGVRVNIRPFVIAGVLRAGFNVKWKKDGGSNKAGSVEIGWAREAQQAAVNRAELRSHDGSERLNDIHLYLETKRSARLHRQTSDETATKA